MYLVLMTQYQLPGTYHLLRTYLLLFTWHLVLTTYYLEEEMRGGANFLGRGVKSPPWGEGWSHPPRGEWWSHLLREEGQSHLPKCTYYLVLNNYYPPST